MLVPNIYNSICFPVTNTQKKRLYRFFFILVIKLANRLAFFNVDVVINGFLILFVQIIKYNNSQ